MNVITVKKGEMIFREGAVSGSMYYIASPNDAKIGIYSNYKTANEVHLTTVGVDKYLGEMSMLNEELRSATAVALTDVILEEIKKEEFHEYFSKNTPRMLEVLKASSDNLRRLTNDYFKACVTVHAYMEAKKSGTPISENLEEQLKKYIKK